jgi:hypothetical protein
MDATMWMILKKILLNGRSLMQKSTYFMISFVTKKCVGKANT